MNQKSNASARKRTGILIILDGFGISPEKKYNAIRQARTPTLDRLYRTYPYAQLEASESHVGLPTGFMGNSEVGHLNIGAGRVVFQDFSLISQAIEDNSFFSNPTLIGLIDKVKRHRGNPTLHLMGLVSDGGVHSHISHLFALIQLVRRSGLENLAVHAITDGRDTSPTSGAGYLRKIQEFCHDAGIGKIATVSGRFYAMDRDKRWERTAEAYRAIVSGSSENRYNDPIEYLQSQYQVEITDEFVPPACAKKYSGISDGDGVIFFNFRADRARQISRAITQSEFDGFRREKFPELSGFVCMTPYEESLHLPSAFEKPLVRQTLGEIVSECGWKQLRVAETEKYAHVTYFFNGGDERVFEGEKRALIPSPRDVRTFDLKPEMSARKVTETLLAEVAATDYQLVVVNFANPDMVGHTGNLRAAISAVEVVDECLGRLVDWVESQGAFAVVTADHGNCEVMADASGAPMTAHTTLPVPFILIDPKHKDTKLRESGRLCDIAPTFLAIWGIEPPPEMTGSSMLAAK